MRRLYLLFLLSGVLVFCTGCLTSSEFNFVERTIMEEIKPVEVRTNFKFSFGPISLSTASAFISLANDEARKVGQYLHEISKCQVGIYEIDRSDRSADLKIPRNVENKLSELGWEIFVRVKEKDANINLFYKLVNEEICSLYAIVLENDEMFIVEVRGRLGKIIEDAIQKHGLPQKELLKNS